MSNQDQEEEQERLLPPIGWVIVPDTMKTTSAKIRWLGALGYSRTDIQKKLGVRYQQVRNVLTTEPKRAAREDLAPLVIETVEMVDDIQAIMDYELDQSLGAERLSRKRRETGGSEE